MAEPPRFPASGDDVRYDDERPRVPHWVTLAVIVAIVVALAVVAVLLIGGGAGHTTPQHGV
jgi:hypothetical protein